MAVRKQRPNSVRLIAGKWRGRKIQFPDAADLRPTPDRVRETLFNWLQTVIPGAVCIDCFAGSGALGFEAASRGAKQVIMLENNKIAAESLRKNQIMLQSDNVLIENVSALDYLQSTNVRADVFFLDPPFALDLIPTATALILARNLLSAGGAIYLEYPVRRPPNISDLFEWRRQKRAAEVGYGLVCPSADGAGNQLPID